MSRWPARAAALAIAWTVLAAGPQGEARADDIYAYELDGKTWFGNYCPHKARKCKLVLRGSPPTKAKPEGAGMADGQGGSTARPVKKWKPPLAVDFTGGALPPALPPEGLDETIATAARTYNIPEAFIRAVITVESGYKTKALSYKGAMGLMQLMPGTAADLGVTDPYDPVQNIMAGTRFLRILANRFEGDIPKVLAAYHAGGHAVAVSDGIPYEGSDGYVRKVLDNYYRLKKELYK
jgi:hypothetical protein